jgi:hypothetical protein
MPSSRVRRIRLIVATAAVAVVCGSPFATAAPATDTAGYVESTARCSSPNTVVLFGTTDSSRVAVCKTSNGQYEYRGVRISDGAQLVVNASPSGDGFVADNNGVSYTVTARSLSVRMGDKVIRDEPMVDFHRPESASAPPPTTATSTTPLPPALPAEVGGRR